MRVCYFTHRGKVRVNNEDALLVAGRVHAGLDFERVLCETVQEGRLFCVADGMGGYEGGEVASRLVLQTFAEINPEDEEGLRQALEEAGKRLTEEAERKPELRSMGCTLAGILLKEDTAVVFNVGDCRVYRVVAGKSVRLSRDHSVVESLVLEGLITREEAKDHPQRHVVTSALMAYQGFEVFIREVELLDGDRFVVCSDGLWEEDENFQEIFESPDTYIRGLFERNVLKDNLSFVAVEVG